MSSALQQHEQLLSLLRAELLGKGMGSAQTAGQAGQTLSSTVVGMCTRYQQAVSAMIQDSVPVSLTGAPLNLPQDGDHVFALYVLQGGLAGRVGTSWPLQCSAQTESRKGMYPGFSSPLSNTSNFLKESLLYPSHAASCAGLLEAYFTQKLDEFHNAVFGPGDEVRRRPCLILCTSTVCAADCSGVPGIP